MDLAAQLDQERVNAQRPVYGSGRLVSARTTQRHGEAGLERPERRERETELAGDGGVRARVHANGAACSGGRGAGLAETATNGAGRWRSCKDMAGEQVQRSSGEGGRKNEKEGDGQREADQDPVAGGRRCARSLLDQRGGGLADLELQASKGAAMA